MKKIIVFLITIMTIFLWGNRTVHAQEYSFYEAEYLDNMYMNKYDYSTNTIYYQRARKFRSKKNGEVVYCIEPLTFFNEDSTYQETTTPRNLSKEQIEQIEKIAYFGFRYKGHADGSWYAVAQIMIWRVANPTGGDYYFTDTLNGNRTNAFDYQIDEINRLIKEYDNEIPIANQKITIVKGSLKEIQVGPVLNHYKTENNEIKIDGEKIIVNDLEEGEYDITLKREKEIIFGTPTVIYESKNSQNMMLGGDLEEKEVHFKLNVISNYIELDKIDEETTIPQGDAKLDGALYKLYNENMEEIETIEIINGKGIIRNIPFGKYYLKEEIPGEGYKLNDTVYEINLTTDNPNKELTVTNQVIKKELTIHKTYEDNKNEANIEFQITNKNEDIVDTLKTDEEGIASTIIPYGTYTITQLNTTEGYELLEPFLIKIDNNEPETMELYDFKIPVPNTSTNRIKTIIRFLRLLIIALC